MTVGGVMSGYCATGNVLNVTKPAMTMTMAMTVENIGLCLCDVLRAGNYSAGTIPRCPGNTVCSEYIPAFPLYVSGEP